MVFISVSDRHLVIGSSDRLLVVDRSADGASFSAVRFQSIPEVSSDLKNKKYDENNRLRDDSPICGSFSPCGQLFAAADASKRLLVWRIISHSGSSSSNASHVSWQLHREFRLEKRPVAIRFVSAQNDVLGM